MNVIRAILPVFRKQKEGLILNVSSVGGLIGLPSISIYLSTKFALEGFSEALPYKGEAENAVLAAGFPHVHIFRPAYIYPVEPRKEPNFNYRLLRAIYPAFRLLFPNQVIRADDLARVMVDAAVYGTGEHRGPVFENRDIRAMAESLRPSR